METILDMHPQDLQFNIYLYPNFSELQKAFKATGTLGRTPIAFYHHGTKTIHLSIDDTTEGVLAHEIAHVVICFYFGTPPPPRTQEILAQYVDKYLWRQ